MTEPEPEPVVIPPALPTGVATFATALATAVGLPVTRDPGAIVPPCVHVAVPTVTGRTMSAYTLEVPVWLIHAAPGDLAAGDWLLANVPALLDACGTYTATPAPFDADGTEYPAMKLTATLTIGR